MIVERTPQEGGRPCCMILTGGPVVSILAVVLFLATMVAMAFWLAHSANEHTHLPSSSSKKADDEPRESSERNE